MNGLKWKIASVNTGDTAVCIK